jgi:hypothetical protein
MTERTLYELLERELDTRDQSMSDLKAIRTSRDEGLVYPERLKEFSGDTGFGSASLPNLYAWSDDYVYFKHVYDGAESVRSVPRNPSAKTPTRIG